MGVFHVVSALQSIVFKIFDSYEQRCLHSRRKESTPFGKTPSLCINLIWTKKPIVLRLPEILNNDPFSSYISLIMHAA